VKTKEFFFLIMATNPGTYPPQDYPPGAYPPGVQPGYPPQGAQTGYPPPGVQPGYPPPGVQPGYPPQGAQPGYPPQGPGVAPTPGGQPAPWVQPTNYIAPPTAPPPLALPPEAHNANLLITPNQQGDAQISFTTEGIKSDDGKLDSMPAIREFIVTHTVRPMINIHQRAWHIEYYVVPVRDANGFERLETRTREVVDLDKHVDISEFASTFYVLYGLDQAERYVQSTNLLRKLTVKKTMDNYLLNICARIRFFLSQRYQYNSCRIVLNNDEILITPDEGCSKCLRSTVTDVLCIISCMWIFYYPIKYCYQDAFKINQVFSWVVPEEQIWISKYNQLMF